MKTIAIIIILLFTACQSGYKGEEMIVTSKELSNFEEYVYYYELEIEHHGVWMWQNDIFIHSNQDWNVGDIIHIGARWGKN